MYVKQGRLKCEDALLETPTYWNNLLLKNKILFITIKTLLGDQVQILGWKELAVFRLGVDEKKYAAPRDDISGLILIMNNKNN